MKSLVIILKNKYQNLTTRTEFHHLIVNKLVKFKIKSNRQKGNQSCNITSAIKEELKNLKIKQNLFIQNRKNSYSQAKKKAKYFKWKNHKRKISYKYIIQKMK